MIIKKNIVVCIWFLFWTVNNNSAQTHSYRFEHYTISNGISNNSINSILQTKDGYLWIATKDGLNRYNGQNFRIFKNDRSKQNSLPENYVMTLLQTKDKTFWVGTWGSGLCKYNFEQETFERYNLKEKSDDFIQALAEDNSGNLWIGTLNGCLYKLPKGSSTLVSLLALINPTNNVARNNVTSLIIDNDNKLWIGTWGDGILVYDIDKNKIIKQIDSKKQNGIDSDFIWYLQNIENKRVLISTNKGLDRYDLTTGELDEIKEFSTVMKSFYDKAIRITYLDSAKRLWAGSWSYQGLLLHDFSTADSGTLLFKKEFYDLYSITSSRIRSIYEDNNKNVWIGTEDGLNKLSPTKQFFQYRYEPFKKNAIRGNVVSSLCYGRNDILYVGYGGSGFDEINFKTKKITHHAAKLNDENSLNYDDIIYIYEDKAGIVWLATSNGGLNMYNPLSKKFKHYVHSPTGKFSINSNWVQRILETDDDKLFVGTNDGLQIFDRKDEKFYPFIPNTRDGSKLPKVFSTNSLYEDSKGNIWIGTWLEGVFCYNKKENTIEHYIPNANDPNSLSSSKVSTILEDKNGFVWFGTHSGGINKFDPRTKKLCPITTKQGLPNDVVFGILEDSNGNLWISTLDGLVKYNPDKNTFRVYDVYDGLVNNQFNWNAYFKDKNGIMYFGGIGGFVYFNPGSITIEKKSPTAVFTSFKIFGKESFIPQVLSVTKEINMGHDQNFFSIDFSVMDFAPKNKHKYSYMLKGVDPRWVESDSRATAFYTKIEPGNYIFKVKSSNLDGVWSEANTIAINILPAWWMTWWFKIIVMVLTSLFIFAAIRFRVKQLLEIQKIRLSIASDLHDEIGSNLSSISVDSQLLINSKNLIEKDKALANYVLKTAQETIESMRDIIWFIYPKNDSSSDILIKMKETAKKILIGISWEFDVKENLHFENLTLDVRRNIYLIFKECLTNVVKHSNTNSCKILIEENNSAITLVVKDVGVGFDVKSTKKNNGIANMKRRANSINAELNIESKEGRGTEITLSVPFRSSKKYFSTFVRYNK